MLKLNIDDIRSEDYFVTDLISRFRIASKPKKSSSNNSRKYMLLATCGILVIATSLHMTADITLAENISAENMIADINYDLLEEVGDTTTSALVLTQNKENERLEAIRLAEIKAQEERDRKAQEEAARKAQEERNRNKYYDVVANTQPSDGPFRLSLYNHTADQMISNINSWFSGYPLDGYGESMVQAGTAYNVDPYVLAAVATEESGRGRYLANSYNPYGIKNPSGAGFRAFSSFDEAICYLAKLLSSKTYLGRGLNTLDAIGRVYCPSPGGWGSRITAHIHSIAG